MQDKKRSVFPDIHLEQLRSISNVHFTSREIDIIACLLNARGTSRIASFLAISPKTVANHIHNVMVKLGCNSREGIIDFIEKSNKQSFLRAHYSHLALEASFKGTLKAISKLRHKIPPYSLIYWKAHKNSHAFLEKLKNHLELASVKTHLEMRNTEPTITHLKNESNAGNYGLYVIPVSVSSVEHAIHFENLTRDSNQISPKHLFLFIGKTNLKEFSHELCGVESIDFTEQENYYFSVFEILKKLLPNANLEKLTVEFKQQYELANESPPMEMPQERLSIKKELPFLPRMQNLLKERKWSLLIGCLAAISVLSIGFFAFKKGKEKEVTIADSSSKQSRPSIRSDLILPSKTTLLNRPELLTQIENKFKNQTGIQTVAIIGIGGSGKTTSARYYAHQQKANIIWEINAETDTSLMESFENLAQGLSKTEEDKEMLREMKEIKNPFKREKKLIEFVKERLKLHSNWFLIYDNVEKFASIQKYFPLDAETWGSGRILITTRDSNIQNNKYVDYTIQIGELSENQKFTLFTKIMKQGGKNLSTSAQITEAKKFLEKIPPFPLDVSVSSSYIKTINISYGQYLDLLKKNDTYVESIQKNILKDSGEYTKTRYALITLSLQKLIESHKNFGDLLLFISLMDSQKIPKELLDLHTNPNIVDNFIYNMKKHSLITTQSSPSGSESILSIHRSTQAIILAYFIKTLNLESINNLIHLIENTLEQYVENVLDRDDLIKAKQLISHLESFLAHDDLLIDSTKGLIESKLGCIFSALIFSAQAADYFERALLKLKKDENQNYNKIAQTLLFQGNAYIMLGDLQKGKNALEESIYMYKRHTPQNSARMALGFIYLGNIYRWTGEYEKAKLLFQQSLNLYETLPLQACSGKVMALAYLGDIYRKLGEYKKGIELTEKSLEFSRKSLRKDSVRVAWPLMILGIIHRYIGNYEESIKLINKSLEIYKVNFSAKSIYIAGGLAELAKVYCELGQYKQAVDLAEQALLLSREFKVYHSVYRIDGFLCLGNAYKGLGNYSKAKTYLEKTLMVYEKHYGTDHIETAHVLESLGHLYFLEDNLKTAEDFLGRALNICQKNNHPSEYKCLESFSDLHLKKWIKAAESQVTEDAQHFKAQASNNLKRALEIVKTHFPENSPHIVRIQSKIKELSKQKCF